MIIIIIIIIIISIVPLIILLAQAKLRLSCLPTLTTQILIRKYKKW